jgi:hypothetical protein
MHSVEESAVIQFPEEPTLSPGRKEQTQKERETERERAASNE